MSFRGQGRGRGRGRGRGGKFGGRSGGPQLPAAMMDEVESAYGSGGRSTGVRARKEERKAKRKPGPQPERREEMPKSKGKRRASPEPELPHEDEEDEPQPPPRKKAKAKVLEPEEPKKPKKGKKEIVLPEDDDDLEDREIKWLEYMLDRNAGEDSDGLDDLLSFADKLGPSGGGLGSGDVSGSDDDDDSDVAPDGEEFDVSDSEEEWQGIADSDIERDDGSGDDESDRGEEEGGVDEAESGDSDKGDEPRASPSPPPEPVPATAPPEAAAPAPGRYVPPHLRAAQLAERAAGDTARALERTKLERKAQGALNKLSEANIESILAETEKLFSDHSRNDVTTTLTTLVIQMIGSKTNLLDSFVVLYASLVGALHRVVGLEFGAHFVQTLVKKYHELYQHTAPTSAEVENESDAAKEAFNLLTLIAELYNAGVIGSQLVYDLVRGFIGETGDAVMTERSVEGLMKILKCSGSQLRSDDPASLKDIVTLVQERTRGKEKDMTTRGRFMIETLVNLRSGKTKGLGVEREDVARMRKFLSGLGKKRRLLAPEPLRVGLKDLLAADSRGKWWLVGAGWSGNPLVERQEAAPTKKKAKKTEMEDEEVLLELARKQGMNTDVRRSVFIVLLTSEDYVHACDRLHAFRLTQVQQREYVRVALHCCGMEDAYNPYYTLVLNNLCANSYDHRFTLQYAVWDLLRELADGGVPEARASNVARSLAFMLARNSVDLTILKAIEFTDLTKPTRKFLDRLMRTLLVSIQTPSPLFKLPRAFKAADIDIEAVEEVFDRALSNPELSGGLAWVLQSIKKTPGKDVSELEGEVVRQGADAAVRVLAKAI